MDERHMEELRLRNIIEAALLAAGRPLRVSDLRELFPDGSWRPEDASIRQALGVLREEWAGRGVELGEVSSGYRFQVRKEYSEWVSRLWAERPARYSRATMETLALIAYRQPITRGEIEAVRGVGVSSSIIRTLLDREWIRVLGHREVPGRPALYGTTRQFLDDLNLKNLSELPPLPEVGEPAPGQAELFPELVEEADCVASVALT